MGYPRDDDREQPPAPVCPVCERPIELGESVGFQGEMTLHLRCWLDPPMPPRPPADPPS